MMQRRVFLIGAAALGLSACSNLLGPPEAGQMYVVRPDFAPPPAGAVKVGWALSILRPDVPGNLDNDRIALVQADGTADFYANATYADRVAPLVQRALLDGFEASGRIGAVAQEQDALHSDYDLITEVKHFEAHYAVAEGIPTVQVTIVAKLVAAHGRTIVATFTADQTATASANSVAAAAQALQAALTAATGAIVTWALAAPLPAKG